MSTGQHSGVSLIISTYNWPQALNLCLKSVLKQSLLPEEIIIADDGSTAETKNLVEQFQRISPVLIHHVWQPDEGFQLARIRNKAIAFASKPYIIQIDGDLILDKNFVKDHVAFQHEHTFVSGSRVIMNKELSERLLASESIDVPLTSKGLENVFNGLRIPLLSKLMKDYKQEDIYYIRGCNMAFWRKDLLRVNGYNESFVGWGREDNEIGSRLINSGVRKRIIKFSGIVFHICHKEKTRISLDSNDQVLQLTISNKLTYCEKGLSQYL
jgi:glycosyltransferase involved in cell wall biosynthesis